MKGKVIFLVMIASLLASMALIGTSTAQYTPGAAAKFKIKLPNGAQYMQVDPGGHPGPCDQFNISVEIQNVTGMTAFGVTLLWNSCHVTAKCAKYWVGPKIKAEINAGNWSGPYLEYCSNNVTKDTGLPVPPNVGAFAGFAAMAKGSEYALTGDFVLLILEFHVENYGPGWFYIWKDGGCGCGMPEDLWWPDPSMLFTTSGWKSAEGLQPYDVVWAPGFGPPCDANTPPVCANAILMVRTRPTAHADGPYSGYEGSPITFNASGSSDPDGDVLQYRWDFNNDGTWDTEYSTDPTASHTYGDDYSGEVVVEVYDGEFTDTDTATVTVNNIAPAVDAGPDKVVNEGAPASFSGSFTDPGWLDTHTIFWDFGDNTNTTGTLTPTHAYGDNGVYTVTLKVTDDDNGVGTDTLTVTVQNVAPTAEAGPDQAVHIGQTVYFNGSATDPGFLDTFTYKWDFDASDGIQVDATGQNVTHVYEKLGKYTVTLNVTDDDGGIGVDTLEVWVVPSPPVGGLWTPVDKLALLAPYISLTLTIIVAIAASVAFRKYRKKQ